MERIKGEEKKRNVEERGRRVRCVWGGVGGNEEGDEEGEGRRRRMWFVLGILGEKREGAGMK